MTDPKGGMTGGSVTRVDAPEVLAVAVEECGEPLVDVRRYVPVFLPHQVDPPLPFGGAPPFLLREGMAQRLQTAGRSLPATVRIVVVSAFRFRFEQGRLYRRRPRSAMAARHGDPAADVAAHVRQYAADPTFYAPHITGGAIDVLLADTAGRLLDMGGYSLSDGRAHADFPGLTVAQRQNRELLNEALQEAGLANYPLEWWHWCFGENYWAYQTGLPAIYGSVPTRSMLPWLPAALAGRVAQKLRRLRQKRFRRG